MYSWLSSNCSALHYFILNWLRPQQNEQEGNSNIDCMPLVTIVVKFGQSQKLPPKINPLGEEAGHSSQCVWVCVWAVVCVGFATPQGENNL